MSMFHRHLWPLLAAVSTIVAAPAPAAGQGSRPIAIVGARIITVSGAIIDKGTVLVRDGKIAEVGTSVTVPPGAMVVDAQGGTLMPGLVSAHSRAGLADQSAPQRQQRQRRGRRSRGGPRAAAASRKSENHAARKVADSLYARQDVFGELLEHGVTTLVVTPSGKGFPGQGARLDPTGKDAETLVADDEAFVFIDPGIDTDGKKLLAEALKKAAERVEARKKAAAEAQKPDGDAAKDESDGASAGGGEKAGDGPKPDEPKPDEPKPDEPKPDEPKPDEPDRPKPEAPQGGDGDKAKAGGAKPEAAAKPKLDPNIEVLADLLERKRTAFVELRSAADLLHYVDAVGDARFRVTVVNPSFSSNEGRLDEVIDVVRKLEAAVLVPPSLDTEYPGGRGPLPPLISPVKSLHDAGVEVGFLLGDDARALAQLRYRLIELVRHGLPEEVAYAAVTLVPAKTLGLGGRIGSIAKGREADLLLFDGDPLDPRARLRKVWSDGELVIDATDDEADPR